MSHALATAALVFAMAAVNAHEVSTATVHKAPTAEEIKRAYLMCSCEALRRTLDGEEVMACSVIYEHLKAQVFNGDFDQLLAWSRSRPLSICAQTVSRLPSP